MGFQKSTFKRAKADTPQVVTLIVDDSGSMDGTKAEQATEAMKDMVIQMQAGNQGSSGFRFLLNIAKFGTHTTSLAEAVAPTEIDVDQLSFTADSGQTEMPVALAWATSAVQGALDACRQVVKNYNEEMSPNPLVVFFSDGANTGGDVTAQANALKSIPFRGGQVDVVAVGIGMSSTDFPVMETIASRPELAVNIDPKQLAEFIAEVGATAVKGDDIKKVVNKF